MRRLRPAKELDHDRAAGSSLWSRTRAGRSRHRVRGDPEGDEVPDSLGSLDRCQDSHRAAVVGAFEHVHRKHAPDRISPGQVPGAALRFPEHPDELASNLADFRASTEADGGPVRASAADLLNEMVANAKAWDYLSQAPSLGYRALLLVAATHDTPDEDVLMHERMARAARAAGGRHVTMVRYEDDHSFSSHRRALADLITSWLGADCAATQTGSQ